MKKENKSSRRIFLEKIAAGTLGVALSAGMVEKAFAGKDSHPDSLKYGNTDTPFLSDKKFVPVMITPFRQNGQIDFDGLSRLTDFYLAAGVKGYFANCQSSEMYFLSEEERLSVTRHVVKRVNGAMSVVATGSFGKSLEEKAEFAKKIYHTGINAVIMITSHFAKRNESDDLLISNCEKFFALTDNIPMGTYECPAPYKRILTPYAFEYLLRTNRLVYHKDTTKAFDKVKVKIDLAKNNKLEFYDACTANTMYSLQAGAKGMSAISGNFYPEILVWMCNNATNPEKQNDVKYIQEQLTKTEAVISRNYPLSSKYFLQKRGLPIEIISRKSTRPMTIKQKNALDETYIVFQGWCDRIGIEPVKG
jgi:4-hydroxy-tetrahydrodipicolinate synthase